MERIIIAFDRDGKFRGASAQDWDGLPVAIDAKQLNDTAPDINVAAINAVAEMETSAAAAIAAQSEAEQAKQVAESERDGIASQLAEANARIAELTTPDQVVTIKAWQAKAILEAQGLLQAAEQVISAMPEGLQKIAVQSAWTNNADFPRNSETIATMATVIGLTEEQVDAMFSAGAALVV